MKVRQAAAAVLGVPLLVVAVLGIEIEVARRGPDIDGEPLALDGVVGSASARSVKTVWLGDSTAAGVGASSVAHSLPWLVAARADVAVDLTVLAVSGDRIRDVLTDQLPQVANLRPRLVFVSVGANDATHLTGQATFRDRFRELLRSLPVDAEVIVLGVPDMGAPPRLAQPLRALVGWSGRRLDEVVQEEAERAGAIYVDIAGRTGPAFRGDSARFFAADRYHPSDDGYDLWADAIEDSTVRRLT